MSIQMNRKDLQVGSWTTTLKPSNKTAVTEEKAANAGIENRVFIRGNAPKGELIVCQAKVDPSSQRHPPFAIFSQAPDQRVNEEATRINLVEIPL